MVCTNYQVHYGLKVILDYLHITLSHDKGYADLSIEQIKCLSDIFRENIYTSSYRHHQIADMNY